MNEYNVITDSLDIAATKINNTSDRLSSKLAEANEIINATLNDECFSGIGSSSIKDSWNIVKNQSQNDINVLKNASKLSNVKSNYSTSDKNVSNNISNIEVLK